jgi:hypothetical protein
MAILLIVFAAWYINAADNPLCERSPEFDQRCARAQHDPEQRP